MRVLKVLHWLHFVQLMKSLEVTHHYQLESSLGERDTE